MYYLSKKITLVSLIFLVATHVFAKPLSNYDHYRILEKKELIETKGTVLMSNSPEDVKEAGILYQGKIEGKGRLLYHHVNESSSNTLRLVIEIMNEESTPQLFRVSKENTEGPSYRFLKTGQALLKNYFESVSDRWYYLQPGQVWTLYDSQEKTWRKGSLLSGMIDVETKGQMRVTYKALAHELEKNFNLKILNRDLAPRGTFEVCERTYRLQIPEAVGHYYHLLGTTQDWIRGKDELTGESALNQGNYGIMEHIQITVSADTTVILCPRGGVFQGVVRWEDGTLHLVERSHAFKKEKECIIIGKLKKGETKQLEYMLPNGSAAPVLLGFWVK